MRGWDECLSGTALAGLFDGDLYEYGDGGAYYAAGVVGVAGIADAAAGHGYLCGVQFVGAGGGCEGAGAFAKQLTAEEAKKYETKVYLAGSDGWDPTKVK